MTSARGSDTVIFSLQVEGTESLSEQDIANMINAAYVKPPESFQRLEPIPPLEDERMPLIVYESAILSLEKLKPRKAAESDETPNPASEGVCCYPRTLSLLDHKLQLC